MLFYADFGIFVLGAISLGSLNCSAIVIPMFHLASLLIYYEKKSVRWQSKEWFRCWVINPASSVDFSCWQSDRASAIDPARRHDWFQLGCRRASGSQKSSPWRSYSLLPAATRSLALDSTSHGCIAFKCWLKLGFIDRSGFAIGSWRDQLGSGLPTCLRRREQEQYKLQH